MLIISPLPHSPAQKIGKYTMLKKSGDVQKLSTLSTQKNKRWTISNNPSNKRSKKLGRSNKEHPNKHYL